MIGERALELGRLVGQSEEYQGLKRANDRMMAEQELRDALERLRSMQMSLAEQADRGEAPRPEQQAELDQLVGRVQAHAAYQGVVAAQSNFDKLMYKVNEQILEGMKKGADSRIISLG
jgi:cell fate (sporulation/competence/biofilm development) regulator YlbF (YheA/YmcA/DUF963 family)